MLSNLLFLKVTHNPVTLICLQYTAELEVRDAKGIDTNLLFNRHCTDLVIPLQYCNQSFKCFLV